VGRATWFVRACVAAPPRTRAPCTHAASTFASLLPCSQRRLSCGATPSPSTSVKSLQSGRLVQSRFPQGLARLTSRQRLEEEAAQAYEEFVAAFDGGGSAPPPPKAFVHGGVVEPGSRPSAEPSGAPYALATLAAHTPPVERRTGARYVPSFLPPSAARPADEPRPSSVFDLPARADKTKPRAIESVIEELQRCAWHRRGSAGQPC